MKNFERRVTTILVLLVVVDLVLATWGFLFPAAWFAIFHGEPYVDPEGLLRRCAGNWLAFFIVQTVALGRWRADKMWLAIVAGCRWGDALTDVTCLTFAAHTTLFARIAFPCAGLANVVIGWALVRSYRALR